MASSATQPLCWIMALSAKSFMICTACRPYFNLSSGGAPARASSTSAALLCASPSCRHAACFCFVLEVYVRCNQSTPQVTQMLTGAKATHHCTTPSLTQKRPNGASSSQPVTRLAVNKARTAVAPKANRLCLTTAPLVMNLGHAGGQQPPSSASPSPAQPQQQQQREGLPERVLPPTGAVTAFAPSTSGNLGTSSIASSESSSPLEDPPRGIALPYLGA
mmetsp:Transcript_54471/g.151811  ORF Transcript_54471/g.151811 Transcript_54471/m.151811 type:complete len:219 (+) Transcript_54471:881-1537(+)